MRKLKPKPCHSAAAIAVADAGAAADKAYAAVADAAAAANVADAVYVDAVAVYHAAVAAYAKAADDAVVSLGN